MRPHVYALPSSTAQRAQITAFETGRNIVSSAEGPRAVNMRVREGFPMMIDPRWRDRPDVRREYYGMTPGSSRGTFRGFSGFGLGDTEAEDVINAEGIGGYYDSEKPCGCHAGLTGGVEGIVKAHPVAVLIGAFLLGYLLKGNAKGLF